MGKKIAVLLFLLLGLVTAYLVIELNAGLGNISRNLASAVPSSEESQYRIAFIYQNNNAAFWNQIKKGAASASGEEHVYVNFMEEIHGQELQTLDYLRLAMDADYDGIIVQGEDERMIPLIQEAWNAGIPSLMIASDLPDSGRLGYVGADNYRVGYVAGKTLVRSINPSVKPKFAVISPLTGSNLQMSVAESLKVFGFREAISSKKTVVPIWEKSNPTLIDSLMVVRGLLQKYPDLNGIYATYPEGTQAAARVALERNAADRIQIIGHGDSPLIRQYLSDGIINTSIVESPYQMGYTAVQEMARYFREGRIRIAHNIDVIFLNRANLNKSK